VRSQLGGGIGGGIGVKGGDRHSRQPKHACHLLVNVAHDQGLAELAGAAQGEYYTLAVNCRLC
jgi:hypothetical protein